VLEDSFKGVRSTELNFETLARAINGYDDAALTARLQIVTSKPDSPIEGIPTYTKPQSEIETVDFSKYFVIIAFHGSTFPPDTPEDGGIELIKIIQDGDNIYIRARFQVPQRTVPPGIITPYYAVKVNKESMVQFGKLTFILLDQSGKERATATQGVCPTCGTKMFRIGKS
jgi:hypothetical protein